MDSILREADRTRLYPRERSGTAINPPITASTLRRCMERRTPVDRINPWEDYMGLSYLKMALASAVIAERKESAIQVAITPRRPAVRDHPVQRPRVLEPCAPGQQIRERKIKMDAQVPMRRTVRGAGIRAVSRIQLCNRHSAGIVYQYSKSREDKF